MKTITVNSSTNNEYKVVIALHTNTISQPS